MKCNCLYSSDSSYSNIVGIVKNLNIEDDGVHLDIACGHAEINTYLKNHNYNFDYIGIDKNAEIINHLKNEGMETYCHTFSCDENDFNYIEDIIQGRKLKLITMLNFLEHISNPECFLQMINKICKKHNALLIVSVPNICQKDIVFKMMEGQFEYEKFGLLDKTQISFFSSNKLEQFMKKTGFKQICNNDFVLERSNQDFPSDSTFLSHSTTIYKYLNHIKELVDPFSNVSQFVRAYSPSEEPCTAKQDNSSLGPFLSVITRTQGKRIEALTETLLCLTAQTNTDFEVLIIGHKLTNDGRISVENVINELPSWMKQKVRLIKVDYGNRTTPLNVGFEAAKGKYISILDDDDIVFDNWVEEFYNLYKKFPGTILHTYSLKQNWKEIDYYGSKALRACGTPDATYCRDFNLLEQITTNFCPTMSYACPSYSFKKLGIKFNEKLSTTEDWDFLMKTAFLTGVSDSNKVTSIYRIWINSENSYSAHSSQEWIKNINILKNYFNKIPIVLPEGYAKKIPLCFNCNKSQKSKLILPKLYVDYGNGFSESNTIVHTNKDFENPLIFEGFSNKKIIHALRFDPSECNITWVSNLKINITTYENQTLNYKLNNIFSNGLRIFNGILFLKSDPQIHIPLTNPIKIKDVKISCNINVFVFDKMRKIKNILFKILKKLKNIFIKNK